MQCYFSSNNIKHIDYKDIELLKKFINPHARIMKGKRSKICSKHQRAFTSLCFKLVDTENRLNTKTAATTSRLFLYTLYLHFKVQH